MKKVINDAVIDMALSLIILGVKIAIYSGWHILPVIFAVNVGFELMTLPITTIVKSVVKAIILKKFESDIDDIKLIAAYMLLAK